MARKGPAKLEARSKVWLELDGKPVFGDGKLHWLELIDQTGSLRAAAAKLGISYRGLWGRLRETEQRLGMTLVARRAGGRGGGGAALTPDARQLIQRYHHFRDGLNELVDRRFAAAFGRGFRDE